VKEKAQEYNRPFYILTAPEPPKHLKNEGRIDGGSSAGVNIWLDDDNG